MTDAYRFYNGRFYFTSEEAFTDAANGRYWPNCTCVYDSYDLHMELKVDCIIHGPCLPPDDKCKRHPGCKCGRCQRDGCGPEGTVKAAACMKDPFCNCGCQGGWAIAAENGGPTVGSYTGKRLDAEQPDPPKHRAAVLREAEGLICGDRNAQYGPPTQDFERIRGCLNALGYRKVIHGEDGIILADIEMHDVSVIMVALKLSRIMQSPQKRDSWVDLAGYAACGAECAYEQSMEVDDGDGTDMEK